LSQLNPVRPIDPSLRKVNSLKKLQKTFEPSEVSVQFLIDYVQNLVKGKGKVVPVLFFKPSTMP